MRIADIRQGTPEWREFRRAHFNASDAAAMLGISPYKTRNELLREYATGIAPEPDEATRRRFAEGHRLEAEARSRVEESIGQELFPVVGEWEPDNVGLIEITSEDKDLPLSASFDGITMEGETVWEHKTLNESLRGIDELPAHYMAQVQQQLLVSGADLAHFHATDGNGGEVHIRVVPEEAWQERIIAGWRQFQKDLDEWQPEETKAEVIGNTPETLPALSIRAEGRIIASNLTQYIAGARAIVAGINTTLVTDQDFADAEKTVKWAREAEEAIDIAKAAMLSQTADIAFACRQLDDLKYELKTDVRIRLEKLVKAEKERRKTELTHAAQERFRKHVYDLQIGLNAISPGVPLRVEAPNFGEAIKGLRTLESIQNALDNAVANGKIETDAMARDWREKLMWFEETAWEHKTLFPDLQSLVEKPLEDFKLVVESRIEQHKRDEAAKLEAERERIRKEEAARIEAEAKQKAAAQKAGADATVAAEFRQQVVAETIETANPLPMMDTKAIRAFLNTRDFGKEENHIRAVLVEFVKFCRQTGEE